MSAIAPILEQQQNEISFAVDDVEPAPKPLPTASAKSQLEEQLGKPLFAFSHDDRFETVSAKYNHPLAHGIHPLAFAVHLAFSEHRPLLLTPDIIWLTIAQGFSHHINNHAEQFRDRFVSHSGKETLKIEVLSIPETAEQWSNSVREWTLLLRDRVGADLYHLLECNFSTTTPNSLTASRIVMMDVFRQYFDYRMVCICGIPKITLLGTVEDWQSICDRVRAIAEYDLSWWTDRLLPICEEFVNTASGQPSLSFWQQIYKPQDAYGGDVITGWLAELFPYLLDDMTKAPTRKNYILNIERSNLTIHDGISPDSLPLGLSQVPFKIALGKQEFALELLAGFIGVYQHPDEGTLSAEIGWSVQERNQLQKLLEKIEREHTTEEPMDWSNFSPGQHVSKEHIQIIERFDGATLYPNTSHSWIVPKYEDCECYIRHGEDNFSLVQLLITLGDGRCIAYTNDGSILLGRYLSGRHPDRDGMIYGLKDHRAIAENIEDLLDRIFQAEGRYYFDDPSFVPIS
ncbi:DUF4419 domain-containing protein [Roseofilum casamattae]|uniref:DUF4419 domain-containing protein n=1 Tax=Roseofilum casamattae BLCC-M143 TaxID=3022442 RepID=A0ABT7BZN9_9CYAN|nr:DUF4419 domain-containing protein [Roseofilum casamattae]MDJ1184636.1 DUF4419 domain-containing protein [Roseofilum casamattae BLCC-M143]